MMKKNNIVIFISNNKLLDAIGFCLSGIKLGNLLIFQIISITS